MKAKLLSGIGLIGCMALLGVSPAAATTYSVSDTAGTLSVNGTITTGGETGVLTQSDITAWSLTISGFGTPFTLTGTNSFDLLEGGDLSATAVGLFFNFANSTGLGSLQFGTSSGFPEVLVEFCNSNLASCGSLVSLLSVAVILANGDVTSGSLGFTGVAEIAQTPLPATLPLFGSGLAVMGLLARRRKRKAAGAIPAWSSN